MKINIGCGDKKVDGFVNVDLYGEPDVRCDLFKFPWPFEDNSIDTVFSEHFLEHVDDYEKTILEIHRVLKPGGVMHFKVPHFRSMAFPWHLHKYAFSSVTCRLLCEQRVYQFGGKRLFEEISLRFNYLGMVRPLVEKILSFLANRYPSKWEYLGLPIDEIEFIARKV